MSYGMSMKTHCAVAFGLLLPSITAYPALAQIQPPTTQQLQQQHDQTMRTESSTVHDNLNQSIQQTPAQPQPIITPSGRVISRPPGYIPMPNPNPSNPDR
jgi:hypothetical protein